MIAEMLKQCVFNTLQQKLQVINNMEKCVQMF